MATLYQHDDYRPAIRDAVADRKKTFAGATFHALAEACRIQDPYLSKVMNGKAHFSRDQLYLATRFLALSEDEASFLELLHDLQTSAVQERKERLQRVVRSLQDSHLDTRKHVRAGALSAHAEPSADAYYLDPLHQIVHVALSIPRYQKSAEQLAKELMLPAERVRATCTALEAMGLAERAGGSGWTSTGRHLHLQRDSRLYGPWEAQLRILGQARRHLLPKELAYSFSVVFSGDEGTRRELVRRILELIKDAEPLVGKAPEDDVYQLDIDLFSWTRCVPK
jgi:uncharacterized protein (TIGR02147 family)